MSNASINMEEEERYQNEATTHQQTPPNPELTGAGNEEAEESDARADQDSAADQSRRDEMKIKMFTLEETMFWGVDGTPPSVINSPPPLHYPGSCRRPCFRHSGKYDRAFHRLVKNLVEHTESMGKDQKPGSADARENAKSKSSSASSESERSETEQEATGAEILRAENVISSENKESGNCAETTVTTNSSIDASHRVEITERVETETDGVSQRQDSILPRNDETSEVKSAQSDTNSKSNMVVSNESNGINALENEESKGRQGFADENQTVFNQSWNQRAPELSDAVVFSPEPAAYDTQPRDIRNIDELEHKNCDPQMCTSNLSTMLPTRCDERCDFSHSSPLDNSVTSDNKIMRRVLSADDSYELEKKRRRQYSVVESTTLLQVSFSNILNVSCSSSAIKVSDHVLSNSISLTQGSQSTYFSHVSFSVPGRSQSRFSSNDVCEDSGLCVCDKCKTRDDKENNCKSVDRAEDLYLKYDSNNRSKLVISVNRRNSACDVESVAPVDSNGSPLSSRNCEQCNGTGVTLQQNTSNSSNGHPSPHACDNRQEEFVSTAAQDSASHSSSDNSTVSIPELTDSRLVDGISDQNGNDQTKETPGPCTGTYRVADAGDEVVECKVAPAESNGEQRSEEGERSAGSEKPQRPPSFEELLRQRIDDICCSCTAHPLNNEDINERLNRVVKPAVFECLVNNIRTVYRNLTNRVAATIPPSASGNVSAATKSSTTTTTTTPVSSDDNATASPATTTTATTVVYSDNGANGTESLAEQPIGVNAISAQSIVAEADSAIPSCRSAEHSAINSGSCDTLSTNLDTTVTDSPENICYEEMHQTFKSGDLTVQSDADVNQSNTETTTYITVAYLNKDNSINPAADNSENVTSYSKACDNSTNQTSSNLEKSTNSQRETSETNDNIPCATNINSSTNATVICSSDNNSDTSSTTGTEKISVLPSLSSIPSTATNTSSPTVSVTSTARNPPIREAFVAAAVALVARARSRRNRRLLAPDVAVFVEAAFSECLLYRDWRIARFLALVVVLLGQITDYMCREAEIQQQNQQKEDEKKLQEREKCAQGSTVDNSNSQHSNPNQTKYSSGAYDGVLDLSDSFSLFD